MGQLERIYMLLAALCAAQGIDINAVLAGGSPNATALPGGADALTAAGVGSLPGVDNPSNAGASSTTLPPPTGSGRKKAKDVLDAGGTLTGDELDEQGCYHDKSINTQKPGLTAKGIYKKGKNIPDETYEAKIAEIKAAVAAEQPAVGQATNTPNMPAVEGAAGGGIPGPGAGNIPGPGSAAGNGIPGPGNIPGPGAGGQPQEHPKKKTLLSLVHELSENLEVDFNILGEAFAEHGSADYSFPGVPEANYDALTKTLLGFIETHKYIAKAHSDILQLNGGDHTYLLTIMEQAGVGANDITLVSVKDIWRLYTKVAEYRAVLENHFQKPVSKLEDSPFK